MTQADPDHVSAGNLSSYMFNTIAEIEAEKCMLGAEGSAGYAFALWIFKCYGTGCLSALSRWADMVFVTKMPNDDWDDLYKEVQGLGIDRLPQYTYTPSSQTLTITMPPTSALKAATLGAFMAFFAKCIETAPPTLQADLRVGQITACNNNGSPSVLADAALSVFQNGTRQHLLALILGLESRDRLKQDAELVLKGNATIQRVVIVKLSESPKFRASDESVALAIGGHHPLHISELDFHFQTPFGPLTAHEATLVGKLSAELQVWMLDGYGNCVKEGEAIDLFGLPTTTTTIRVDLPGGLHVDLSINCNILPQFVQAGMDVVATERLSRVTEISQRV